MTPTATNDTGIVGDQNTNITNPRFVGQVFAPLPGHRGRSAGLYRIRRNRTEATSRSPSAAGGRGFTGTFDDGRDDRRQRCLHGSPQPAILPARVPDVRGRRGRPGRPAAAPRPVVVPHDAFRIDLTAPQITGASFMPGGPLLPLPNSPAPNFTAVSSLTSLTLNVVDPVTQALPILVTPITILFDALNPATAAEYQQLLADQHQPEQRRTSRSLS